MRIVDLECGMVIEIREGVFYLVRRNLEGKFEFTGKSKWDELSVYKDDLKHVSFPELDIIRVYKSHGKTFDTIFSKCNLELIWERKEEIDWSKVPKWTKVQTTDYKDDFKDKDFEDENYLISYEPKLKKYPFIVTKNLSSAVWSHKYCRIHPSVEIKEEWCK